MKNWKMSTQPEPTQPNPWVNPTSGQLCCHAWRSILQTEQNRQPAAQSNREHQNDAISFRCCACSVLQRHRQHTDWIGRQNVQHRQSPDLLCVSPKKIKQYCDLSVCLSVCLSHGAMSLAFQGYGYYRTLIENSMLEVEPTGVTWPLMMGTYRFAVIVSIEHRLTRVTGYNALT